MTKYKQKDLEMGVAGIDIGSSSAKAVILENRRLVAYSIILTGPDSLQTAHEVFNIALGKAHLTPKDIEYTVATGYGRSLVPFGQKTITEISCHAKGAHSLFPTARTILDMGGQDCKAISCDEKGDVLNFSLNDKCAAGTGRFLEVMAEIMGLIVQDIGALSLKADKKIAISSVCTVFAKSEVLRLLRRGVTKPDILGGLHEAACNRVLILLNRVGIKEDFAITGGIAKNIGVVKRLEEKVGLTAKLAEEPQIVGALGAALFASDVIDSK